MLGATLSLMPAKPARVARGARLPRHLSRAAAAANAARALTPGRLRGDGRHADRAHPRAAHDHEHAVSTAARRASAWLMVEHGADDDRARRAPRPSAPSAKLARAGLGAHPRRSRAAASSSPTCASRRSASTRSRSASPTTTRAGKTPRCRRRGSSTTCASCTRCTASSASHGSLYGHFGAGLRAHAHRLRARSRRENIARYRDFTAAAAQLVVAHGGSLSRRARRRPVAARISTR